MLVDLLKFLNDIYWTWTVWTVPVNLYKYKSTNKPVFRWWLSLERVVPRGATASLTTSCPLVALRYLLIHSNLGTCEGDLQTSEEEQTRENKRLRIKYSYHIIHAHMLKSHFTISHTLPFKSNSCQEDSLCVWSLNTTKKCNTNIISVLVHVHVAFPLWKIVSQWQK